jgi:hypothetical protein
MAIVSLIPSGKTHLTKVIRDLMSAGWTSSRVPADGRIPRNGLKLILESEETALRLRVFAYKVTSSGRNRPQERRVEITTTYQSGLKPLRGFADIVIGLDVDTGTYVGVDSKRLRIGGSSHNASSFFDLEGLSVGRGELLINPRRAQAAIFPGAIEFHAFFDKSRLAEYLMNHREIHAGSYTYGGSFNRKMASRRVSLPIKIEEEKLKGDTFVLQSKMRIRTRPPSKKLVEAVEENDFSKLPKSQRTLTPEQLKQLLLICEEVGALGEQAVLFHERKRLIRLGYASKANAIERVSLRSVTTGYDILSFENDGRTRRYLEVKSTVGTGCIVDISKGEWAAAKQYGDRYYIVRVIKVRTGPELFFIRNPIGLEQRGKLQKTPTGWKLDLRSVMT